MKRCVTYAVLLLPLICSIGCGAGEPTPAPKATVAATLAPTPVPPTATSVPPTATMAYGEKVTPTPTVIVPVKPPLTDSPDRITLPTPDSATSQLAEQGVSTNAEWTPVMHEFDGMVIVTTANPLHGIWGQEAWAKEGAIIDLVGRFIQSIPKE